MSKISRPSCLTGAAPKRQVHRNRKSFSASLLLALLLGLCPARADGPDDEYLQIYNLIQQADASNANGKAAPAKAKYQEAQTALRNFQKAYPDWNVKLVRYRLNDLAQKAAALSAKPPAAAGGATATNAPAAQGTATTAAQTSLTQVKLLEAGAEPRKMLRLQPKPGDKQTMALTMKMAMETKAGEMEVPAMKMPAIKMTLDATVKEVSDNGDITYEIVMGDTSVSDGPGTTPETAEAMKAAFAGVKGFSGAGRVSNRGFSNGVEFKPAAGSNPQTRLLMDQMKDSFARLGALLPEEAVGPGARWEVKMPIKAQGMTIAQTATYEVVSLEGERLTTRITVAQHAANQKVQNPAMPGLKLDLTKMAGKGTGDLTLDLAKLLPAKGTTDFHSETSMAMDLAGQKQTMTVKMDLNLRLETK